MDTAPNNSQWLPLGAGVPVRPSAKAAAKRLLTRGRAVAVKGKDDEQWLVEQRRVRTYAQFTEVVGQYRSILGKRNTAVLFRGQQRDYFDSAGFLATLPAALRSLRTADRYMDRERLTTLLESWYAVLKRCGVDCSSRVGFTTSEGAGLHWIYADKSAQSRLASNPSLMAIAMHYGLKTPFLDVTPDPDTALWFALHRAARDKKKRIHFSSRKTPAMAAGVRASAQTDWAAIPSVQVYGQWKSFPEECPVIDLTEVKGLKGVADRPFIQHAVSLPFELIRMYPGAETDIGCLPEIWFSPVFRYPSAVIKICFAAEELEKHRPDLTADYLFPKDELLYAELLKAAAPELAVYR